MDSGFCELVVVSKSSFYLYETSALIVVDRGIKKGAVGSFFCFLSFVEVQLS